MSVTERVIAFWFKGVEKGKPVSAEIMKAWYSKNDDLDRAIK